MPASLTFAHPAASLLPITIDDGQGKTAQFKLDLAGPAGRYFQRVVQLMADEHLASVSITADGVTPVKATPEECLAWIAGSVGDQVASTLPPGSRIDFVLNDQVVVEVDPKPQP